MPADESTAASSFLVRRATSVLPLSSPNSSALLRRHQRHQPRTAFPSIRSHRTGVPGVARRLHFCFPTASSIRCLPVPSTTPAQARTCPHLEPGKEGAIGSSRVRHWKTSTATSDSSTSPSLPLPYRNNNSAWSSAAPRALSNTVAHTNPACQIAQSHLCNNHIESSHLRICTATETLRASRSSCRKDNSVRCPNVGACMQRRSQNKSQRVIHRGRMRVPQALQPRMVPNHRPMAVRPMAVQ